MFSLLGLLAIIIGTFDREGLTMTGWTLWIIAAAIGAALAGALAGIVGGWLLWRDRAPSPRHDVDKGLDLDDPAQRARLEAWLAATDAGFDRHGQPLRAPPPKPE